MLDMALAGPYTSAASEMSLLWVLYQMAVGRRAGLCRVRQRRLPGFPPGGRDGRHLPPMAAELGDALQLSRPVRKIAQDADGVTVRSDGLTVRARRVIVAIPLAIASQIGYEPMLPVDRFVSAPADAQRRDRQRSRSSTTSRSGAPTGLSGQTASPGSLATLTIDACTDTGTPGVMCVITEGPAARRLGRLDEAERKAAVVGELVDRFGEKAGSPIELPRAGLEYRALFRWRDDQPRAHRRADRVRLHPARAVRPHPLGRDGELGRHVRMGRRRHPLRGARRRRSAGPRNDSGY